jgi:hypothetical protein
LDFLIFFSYRWINQDRSLNTPDDANHTQYRRMLDATEMFLQQNPSVDRERLCIWMVRLSQLHDIKAVEANTVLLQDFACVDQDDPGAGVSSLPIIITQCDVVISLVDDTYYERAWCCVEAMMISQLEGSSYQKTVHQWYEHIVSGTEPSGATTNSGEWALQRARQRPLNMKDKKLAFEHDRPKVMFLERQSTLLGRVIG